MQNDEMDRESLNEFPEIESPIRYPKGIQNAKKESIHETK
jgi:hypothetical protein